MARRRAAAALLSAAAPAAVVVAACDDPAGTAPASPAAALAESGGGQRGQAGAGLPVGLTVRVVDGTGAGVAGVDVAFRPSPGSGRVEADRATTASGGLASAGIWTLGEAVGPQRVEAVVDGLAPAVFTAVATGIPASVRVVAGDGQAGVAGERVPVSPVVRVSDAQGRPLAGIAVAFIARSGAVLGAQAVTSQGGEASPEAWRLGPVAGAQELLAAVPGGGVEGNPATVRALAKPGPAARLTIVAGDGQEVEAGSAALAPPKVRVGDRHGNGVPGVRVTFAVAAGGGSVVGGRQVTDSLGHAEVGEWTVGAALGPGHVLRATATSGGEDFMGTSVSFSATAVAPSFDLQLVHAGPSRLAPDLHDVFAAAEARWETAIGGNLPPVAVKGEDLARCTDEIEHPPLRRVDDVLAFAVLKEVDGPGGIVASAGPCFLREENGLPAVGVFTLDAADVERLNELGHLSGTVLHELAHVLGFGTLWRFHGLLRDPAGSAPAAADTHFDGPAAVARFDLAGGAAYAQAKVPVENRYGVGTRNVHWRESVLGDELMTGLIDPGRLNPFSAVTIASMEDLGYAGVDYAAADAYRLSSVHARRAPPSSGPPLVLSQDVRQGPVGVLNSRGDVVRWLAPLAR